MPLYGQTLFRVTIIIFFVLFSIKILFWWFLGSKSIEYRLINITRFHCMMLGSVGAILFYNQQLGLINFLSNKIVQLFSWVTFFLMGFEIVHVPALISNEVIAIASLSMIVGQVTVSNRIFNLENVGFDFIGKISYGIYVIHPLIIFLLSALLKKNDLAINLKFLIVYSSVLIFTVFFAWLSYTFFESPFLKLKVKFSNVNSSNSMLSEDIC